MTEQTKQTEEEIKEQKKLYHLAEEKLIKARIRLQSRSPFFSYLALYLKFIGDTNNQLPEYAGMGVSPNGTLIYKQEFVNKLTDEECMGTMIHEILHLGFLHLLRRYNRNPEKWNISADLVVNSILTKNNFELPSGCLIPENNKFDFKEMFKRKCIIENIDEKTSEEIYEELGDFREDKKGKEKGKIKNENGSGSGSESGNGRFDEHMEKNLNGKVDKQEEENEWLSRLEEAYVSSKQKGNTPLGMERYIKEIKKSQINWKVLLEKIIQATIPQDQTWCRRNKKSMATKIYMPSTLKEKIDICIGIDLSGSIGTDELTEFMSEIIGISKAFKQNITMRLLTHDVDVHNDYEITNGNIAKIRKLKLKGGGGTSHEPIFKYVDEKVKNCKAVIFFTDGYSDLEEIDFKKHKWKKIFIINKEGNDDNLKKRSDCVCIKMRNIYKEY